MLEQYSHEMQQAVAQQLRKASPDEFELLRSYYERRGGPGLELLNNELQARNLTPTATIRPMYPFTLSSTTT